MPIVVSLDLHGVLTERMLRHADAVVCYLTYPHVDMRDDRPARGAAAPADPRRGRPAGDRAGHDPGARPRRRAHHGHRAVRPVHATGRGARGERRRAGGRGPHQQPVHRRPGAPDQRLRDDRWRPGAGRRRGARPGRPASGRSTSGCSSRSCRSRRPSRWRVPRHDGTVILTDAADATSSGASGDSNAILRALADGGYRGHGPGADRRCPTRSPRAWRPGVGGTAPDDDRRPARSGAVRRRCRSRDRSSALGDGRFTSEADGLEWWSGATAVLKNETMTIVATSRPVMLYDRSLFLAHGQDPRDFDAVVVKSPHCEPRFFRDWAARIDRRRCARLDQREPAQPRPLALPAADLPARRRRPVHAARRAVLAAAVRRPARAWRAPVRWRRIA